MHSLATLATLVALPALVLAGPAPAGAPKAKRADAQIFLPPAYSPFSESDNYVGKNNGSLPKPTIVAGKYFDRFIQIWLENTDYQVAASTVEFQALAKEGLVLDSYYALTHVRVSSYSYILCTLCHRFRLAFGT